MRTAITRAGRPGRPLHAAAPEAYHAPEDDHAYEAAPTGPRPLLFGLFANQDEAIDTALTTASLTGLFFAAQYGSLAILLYLGAGSLLALRGWAQAIRGVFRFWTLLPFALFATASVAWSNYPELSLRAGIQLSLTMLFTIIIACRISGRQFIAALWVAAMVVCIYALIFPNYNYGNGIAQLIGPMGSKNQMSFLAGTAAFASLCVMVDSKHLLPVRVAAVPAMLLGLGEMFAADSAGGLVGFCASVGVLFACMATIHLRQRVRIFLLAAFLIVATPLAVMGPTIQAAAEDFVVNVLHKDTTLTGRTYLWDRGFQLIAERPVLGVGYHAFWVQGEPDAEGLWAYAGVGSRMGFNFHNQYIDTLVTLGWVGLVIMVLGIVVVALGVSLESLIAPSISSAFFFATVVMDIIRTFTETVLIAEWNFYMVIFYAGGVFGWRALEGAKLGDSLLHQEGARVARPRSGVYRPRMARPARATRRAMRGG